MNANDLSKSLKELRAPTLTPGEHMKGLEVRLSKTFPNGSRTARRRHHVTLAALGAVFVAGLGFAAAPFMGRITQTVTWSETGERFIALDQVPPEYRSELVDKWEHGDGVLLEKEARRVTRYRVKYTFADGHTEVVNTFAPPDPAQRRELKQLIARGNGEVVGTVRNPTSGMLTYLNRYTFSGGETTTMARQFPPMADEQREQAKTSIARQVRDGEGVVVGELKGMVVVEYQLPGGQPFTSVAVTPPARLTPQREEELFAMKSAGKGRLVQRIITAEGFAFLVEYELSDGAVFRIGHERPPMTDAEWENVAKEIGRKVDNGEYVEETIIGTDGLPVEVLTLALDSGSTFQVPKRLQVSLIEAYYEQFGR